MNLSKRASLISQEIFNNLNKFSIDKSPLSRPLNSVPEDTRRNSTGFYSLLSASPKKDPFSSPIPNRRMVSIGRN